MALEMSIIPRAEQLAEALEKAAFKGAVCAGLMQVCQPRRFPLAHTQALQGEKEDLELHWVEKL